MKYTHYSFLIVIAVLLCFTPMSAQKTKYSVIIMMDGARYSETFGDSTHELIPFLWNELRPQGVIYTQYYNNGKTQTNPGHASVLSGVWQYIANDGSEYSHSPSLFEYFRKQTTLSASSCWVALGKDKLNVLATSTHPDYGAAYGASVKTSTDPSDDALTYQNVLSVLTGNRSRITIANFAKVDIDGHAGTWDGYRASIKRADSLIALLWRNIQSDPELKNRTTLVVTNDHGRHTNDFVNHGDGCDGCRHIMLMVLGPDTPKGIVDSSLTSQIDIAPTIAQMMRFDTPLAQGKIIASAVAAASNLSLSMKNSPTAKINGDYPLQWSAATAAESLRTIIDVSKDGGISWTQLYTSMANDSGYLWKTTNTPDGTRYRLRIRIFGDTSYGIAQSAQDFTVDNPGNGAPDVVLNYPNRNNIISGTAAVTWSAADAEGDELTMSLTASTDNGATWTPVASGLSNTGTYQWFTPPFANSKSFRLRLSAADGTGTTEVLSTMFEVDNIREKVPSLTQKAGHGNGIVSVNISVPEQLTGDHYRISFSESPLSGKRYTVKNLTKNSDVLISTPFSGDGSEGPLFDGLRLAVTDYPEPEHNKDSTRWISGTSTLFSKVSLPELILPEGNIQALPEAADYEIRISAVVTDTSKEYFGATAVPLYYTVFNTTFNRKTPLVITELSPDGKLSFGDDLYLFMKDSSGKELLSWEVFIDGELSSIEPKPGDIYRIVTNNPITGSDLFEFDAVPTAVPSVPKFPSAFGLSQNYPNPFNPSTSFTFSFSSRNAGERGMLTVFNVLGQRVATLFDGPAESGKQYHRTFNASSLASGMYLVRLTCGTDMQIRKITLVK